MNIIKFKDSIRPGDTMFNSFLKGKYAYWVRMRYVVPFEVITPQEYVMCEHDVDKLKVHQGKYKDMFKDQALSAWVDELETENVNDVQKYIQSNKFTTDPALTIDDVKKFRTWLAKTLLELDQTTSGRQKHEFYSEEFTHVLEYYANGMYDDIIKWLHEYGEMPVDLNLNTTTCGCVPAINTFNLNGGQAALGCSCGSANNDILLNPLGVCDPIAIYRAAIKAKMVEYFGDMNFWIQMPLSFLSEFKAYIDNIIKLNLPFDSTKFSNFEDCACGKSTSQLAAMEILGRLRRSLELIITENTVGNRNYISDAFMDWAKNLYEIMEWA